MTPDEINTIKVRLDDLEESQAQTDRWLALLPALAEANTDLPPDEWMDLLESLICEVMRHKEAEPRLEMVEAILRPWRQEEM